MQKVDLVIAGVGALALIATVLGVVFYEEVAGAETLEFEEVTQANVFDYGAATGTEHEQSFDLPDNATGAEFRITVAVSGNTLLGGDVTVSVTATGPNGTTDTETRTISIDPGTVSGASNQEEFSLSLRWADVPGAISADDPAAANLTKVWDEPASFTVAVTGPGNQAGDSLVYTVSAEGDAMVYRQAPPTIPDPQGGQ